ncbi:hypothetical protein PMG11_11325 [Penicillium brasilianum]|uniref:Uncharacterized protein n=1 Tax=Penicillium brasilianum TaxID=104259 RepID=A0A0F7U4Y4_PENBI|nr:hypothetical protein PMG11_11325 [Penicillium brasilianum]
MHLQLDDTSSSMDSGGNSENDWNVSCRLEGSCCQWPGFQADYRQFPVDWSYVQNTFWSDMESSSYAPVQQDQTHSMDWFQYGSDLESEVEFIARNPTVEPYSVAKSMITENTPVGTPNGGWRKTSWPDFEEFTRLVCGDREHSSHTRGGNSNAPLQGAVVAFDISKAYSVICPATCLRGHTSAGFRSASAASPVATTSKPIMQRMVDREAAIATWLL